MEEQKGITVMDLRTEPWVSHLIKNASPIIRLARVHGIIICPIKARECHHVITHVLTSPYLIQEPIKEKQLMVEEDEEMVTENMVGVINNNWIFIISQMFFCSQFDKVL